jgi:exodeoxyribonuclease-3
MKYGLAMKIATWNVNSLQVRLPQVLDWLAAHPEVAVLALQETKTTDEKFPRQAFADAGYRAEIFGQKTYNGVALISRENLPTCKDVVRNIPGFEDDLARVISGSYGDLRVVGAYFPNGQEPGSDKFAYKMRWLDALRTWLQAEMARYPHLVLMGDFNITVDDRDVHDPVALSGTIHCTEEERAHFQALVQLGLTDALRLHHPEPKLYSWWDYREMAFRRNRGLRIDHVLVSSKLQPLCVDCVIDKAPRKNERPSDHAPVVLEIKGPIPGFCA